MSKTNYEEIEKIHAGVAESSKLLGLDPEFVKQHVLEGKFDELSKKAKSVSRKKSMLLHPDKLRGKSQEEKTSASEELKKINDAATFLSFNRGDNIQEKLGLLIEINSSVKNEKITEYFMIKLIECKRNIIHEKANISQSEERDLAVLQDKMKKIDPEGYEKFLKSTSIEFQELPEPLKPMAQSFNEGFRAYEKGFMEKSSEYFLKGLEIAKEFISDKVLKPLVLFVVKKFKEIYNYFMGKEELKFESNDKNILAKATFEKVDRKCNILLGKEATAGFAREL